MRVSPNKRLCLSSRRPKLRACGWKSPTGLGGAPWPLVLHACERRMARPKAHTRCRDADQGKIPPNLRLTLDGVLTMGPNGRIGAPESMFRSRQADCGQALGHGSHVQLKHRHVWPLESFAKTADPRIRAGSGYRLYSCVFTSTEAVARPTPTGRLVHRRASIETLCSNVAFLAILKEITFAGRRAWAGLRPCLKQDSMYKMTRIKIPGRSLQDRHLLIWSERASRYQHDVHAADKSDYVRELSLNQTHKSYRKEKSTGISK